MSVPVAYATMLVVWSTTPLGIAWSNETISPAAAIALRMVFAACFGLLLLCLMGIELSWQRAAVRAYAASAVGVFGALSCTYFAAGFVPSGLVSVFFALAPILSNVFAKCLLGKGEFNLTRVCAYIVSFAGLALICLDTDTLGSQAYKGMLLLALAVSLYSLSGVLLQRESYQAHPLSVSVGTLVLSVPLFLLSWALTDGQLPQITLDSRSIWAVLYLALCGSLLGFMAYFHVLNSLGAVAVAMVTLITPVSALALGSLLNNEPLSWQMVYGTVAVLAGLLLYYQNDLLEWCLKLRHAQGE